jgi:hypothetical protein
VSERPGEAAPVNGRPSAEDIAWVGLWPASLVLAVCLLWLAPPLSDLYPEPSHRLFPVWEAVANPEPLEATRFLFALVVPFALAGTVLLGSAASPQRRLDPAVIVLQAAAIGLIAWGAVEQDTGPYVPFPPDYFGQLLLSVPVVVLGVAIGLALVVAAMRKASFDRLRAADRASPGWRRGAFVVAIALTALWLLPAVVTDGTVAASGVLPSGHIPVQGEDYFAVVNGRTPFVDYVPQYVHLLPLVVAPVLAAFDMSLTSFSLLMVGLSLAAMLALYGVFLQVTGRPVAALALYVPVLAISLIPWAQEGVQREFNASYYAFFPGRYLGPFLVAWLCAVVVRGRRVPAWLPFLIAGLAALNNAEFGVPSVLALTAALALGSDREQPFAARARNLLLPAAAGLCAATALVIVVVLVRAGELPDFGSLAHYSDIFARQGFGLVPMPTLGLHVAVYFTYVAAILATVVRYVRQSENPTLTAMLAFAGVFGLLTGSYFAGRSLPWQLMLMFPIWGLALALLTWTTLLHLRSTARKRGIEARYFLPAAATLIGFGVMVAAIIAFPLPWKQVERLSDSGPAVNDAPGEQRFVEDRTTSGEPVVILGTPTDHRLAERAGVANLSPWNGIRSVYSERDVDRAVEALERAGGSKVFLGRTGESSVPSGAGAIGRTLAAHGFEHVAENPAGLLVLWRPRGEDERGS